MPEMAEEVKQARREKRYQNLLTTIERTQRRLDKADKTARRLLRSLAKLEQQRRRLEKARRAPAPMPQSEPEPEHPRVEARERAVANSLVENVTEITELTSQGGFGVNLDDIPDWMLRRLPQNAEPEAVKELVEREQEKQALTKEKARVKREKRKAADAGDTRRLPLQGREALAAIKGEPVKGRIVHRHPIAKELGKLLVK